MEYNSGSNRASNFKSAERAARSRFEITSMIACLQAVTVGSIAENPFRSLIGHIIQNGSHEKRTPGFLGEEKLQRLQVGYEHDYP